jgi:hypothetical protein
MWRRAPSNSPDPRLELTDDDKPLTYCTECWQREFDDET